VSSNSKEHSVPFDEESGYISYWRSDITHICIPQVQYSEGDVIVNHENHSTGSQTRDNRSPLQKSTPLYYAFNNSFQLSTCDGDDDKQDTSSLNGIEKNFTSCCTIAFQGPSRRAEEESFLVLSNKQRRNNKSKWILERPLSLDTTNVKQLEDAKACVIDSFEEVNQQAKTFCKVSDSLTNT